MQESGQCADCGCDLLLFAKKKPTPGLIAAIQFVRRAIGRQVFICWRCAAERYKARQVKMCYNNSKHVRVAVLLVTLWSWARLSDLLCRVIMHSVRSDRSEIRSESRSEGN